jgi:hypothetical protein
VLDQHQALVKDKAQKNMTQTSWSFLVARPEAEAESAAAEVRAALEVQPANQLLA